MRVNGWDIPVYAANHYGIYWSEFLRGEHPRKKQPKRTIEEYVVLAERIVSDHGILPRVSYLSQHGYSGLVSCIAKHPERFDHIPKQHTYHKTVEEHVAKAEHLATEHGGLPGAGWLQKNGHSKLYECILRHPNRFDHIARLPLFHKTIDEHVADAEEIAIKNNGLPRSGWLQKHKRSALKSCIEKYPERFAHIPRQSSKRKTVDEHIIDAEKLAIKHGGLPQGGWLQKNNYGGLVQCIRRCPERFDHISRIPINTKTIDKHIADAEHLASEHNGLPGSGWLQKHKRCGLRECMRLNPERFTHIPRQPRNTQEANHTSTSKTTRSRKVDVG